MVEFVILLVAWVSMMLVAVYVYIKSQEEPVREMKLLSFGLLLMSGVLGSMIPATLLYSTDPNPLAIVFHRLFFLISSYGILFMVLAFLLTNLGQSYRSVFMLVFYSSLVTASAFVNAITLTHEIVGGKLQVDYDPIGLFLFIATIFFSISFFIYRAVQVKRIVGGVSSPFTSYQSLLVFAILGSLAFGTLFATRIVSNSPLPTFTWGIFVATTVLYFIRAFSKDKAFFFITETKLDGIIVTDKNSGLTLQSKSFTGETEIETLLGSIFSALNMSIKDTIRSEKELEHVSFGDKVVLASSGTWCTVFGVVSQRNFVAEAVVRFVALEYEKIHEGSYKTGEVMVVTKEKEQKFESLMSTVRRYLPL